MSHVLRVIHKKVCQVGGDILSRAGPLRVSLDETV